MKPTIPKAARLLIALVGALAAIVAAVTSAAIAAPVTPTAKATLTAGSPTISQPTSSITIAGTLTGADFDYFPDTLAGDQLKILNPGEPTGWNVTASATAFTCEVSSTCHSDTFSGLSINSSAATAWNDHSAPSTSCATSCVAPTNTTSSTVGWGDDLSAGSTTLYTSDADSGLGAVLFSTQWWVAVPNTVSAGAYDSTVTLDIAANGP